MRQDRSTPRPSTSSPSPLHSRFAQLLGCLALRYPTPTYPGLRGSRITPQAPELSGAAQRARSFLLFSWRQSGGTESAGRKDVGECLESRECPRGLVGERKSSIGGTEGRERGHMPILAPYDGSSSERILNAPLAIALHPGSLSLTISQHAYHLHLRVQHPRLQGKDRLQHWSLHQRQVRRRRRWRYV